MSQRVPDAVQSEVVQAYDQITERWSTNDPRDHSDYFRSKVAVDHRLLNMIDIAGKSVLNVGCSWPIDEWFFARRVNHWVATDLSVVSLDNARCTIGQELAPPLVQRISFCCNNAVWLPFGSERFDACVSFSTLDHIPDPSWRQMALHEMTRVTKRGGHVIVTGPNKLHLLYYSRSRYQQQRGTAEYGYEHCFTPRELRGMCKAAGLQPLEFVGTFSPRDIDMSRSPKWLRLPIELGLVASRLFGLFGHRIGFLCLKAVSGNGR
jgi:ubiquinone/menaquinone biosynthesis C-methylase UbiE